ncbi:MAG TPA: type II toxin-antitoxin system Phd/YefM family antitoxin [Longimicrobium sp.]|nr:type II toxin-antitoxin system Phd/YefM family antitoxin [Longimicrobium sp.]
MSRKALSVAEAKATLSEQIREVENGEPVLITRHGRPVVALVRAEDLDQLERLRAAGPQGGLASIAGGWEGSDELADLLAGSHRTAGREGAELDAD